MMIYCDIQNCKNRKICNVYNVIVKYQPEILISVNSCSYISDNQKNFVNSNEAVKDPIAVAERSQKIKGMLHSTESVDAPQAIKSVRGTGMQFDIDDKEIN